MYQTSVRTPRQEHESNIQARKSTVPRILNWHYFLIILKLIRGKTNKSLKC